MSKVYVQPELSIVATDMLGLLCSEPERITMNCPHCRCPVVYPLIAKERHVDEFETLLRIANQAIKEMGITDYLISNIKARCYIELARRNGTTNHIED